VIAAEIREPSADDRLPETEMEDGVVPTNDDEVLKTGGDVVLEGADNESVKLSVDSRAEEPTAEFVLLDVASETMVAAAKAV
jgi:hypothetical protein